MTGDSLRIMVGASYITGVPAGEVSCQSGIERYELLFGDHVGVLSGPPSANAYAQRIHGTGG